MAERVTISNSFTVQTAEDGKDGKNSAIVRVTPQNIFYLANNNGVATSTQTFTLNYSLVVGNTVIATSDITSYNVTKQSSMTGVTIRSFSKSSCSIGILNRSTLAALEGYITITLGCTIDGVSYTGSVAVSVVANRIGADGARGEIGRFFYYGGLWDEEDDEQEFLINDVQAPYFKVVGTEGNTTITRYYVFNPDVNPDTKVTMAWMHGQQADFSKKPWQIMTDDFKYIITEALFADFAHFGSAIINGDWMISQHGTINGATSEDYTKFDPAYPYQSVNTTHNVNGATWTGYNFVPNYCVDLLTGATFQQNAYVIGKIYSTIGEIGGFVLGQHYIGNIQTSGDQFIGSRIYSDGGAMFGNNTSNGYALQTSGSVEMVGNGKNIIINTRTGSESQHGDFVINGWMKVIGLPTSSSGLATGEVYVDNGVLKVKT